MEGVGAEAEGGGGKWREAEGGGGRWRGGGGRGREGEGVLSENNMFTC